jgi:hypothetical protein
LDFDQAAGEEQAGEWRQSRGTKMRVRKKELPQVHLPSEEIYLQRLQVARPLQKPRQIRTKKSQPLKQAERFMDDDNEIYDLDF